MNRKINIEDLSQALARLHKFGVDQSESGKAARTRGLTRYGSKLEALAADYLEILHPVGLQRQVKFPMVVAGRKVATYQADFVVGRIVYEAKGKMMPDAKIKLELFRALYTEYTLYLVKASGNPSNPLKIESYD